ncbi:MAG TPA: signal peptidase I, partial [Tepidiformaceae bacterium]|nr:signal peptidase I [Tepidiformaceae bacterium]
IAASVEPTVEEPVADEKPWWERAETDAPAAEPVASVEPTVEEPVAEDDDPWAAFVGGESRDEHVAPVVPSFAASTPPTWPANPVPDRDEDMWGDIAAQAEEAAYAADDAGIDLAASLESQMAAASDRPAEWERGGRTFEREAGSPGTYATDEDGTFEDADDDVILRAFERHAATPDAEPALQRETEEALAELFGNNAAQIVDGPENEAEPQSFMRLGGFAPQRGSEAFDGNWGPEQEEIDALERGRRMHGGSDGGFIVAPWDGDEIDAEAAHAGSGAKLKTWVRELVETGLLALLVFLSVRASFQNFKVDGNSMLPTLEDGQFLIVNKLVYSEVDMEKLGKYVPFINAGDDEQRHIFHGPERGDIVVLRDPRKPETDLIKRVIGLPGETVEIVNGKVFINDMLLEEPYITTPWNDTKTKILIPEGEYYVLGDNRDNSLDSRSSQVGLVPEDLIIGKAMLSYWPRDKFGLAANEEGSLTEQKPVLTTQRIGAD